MTAKATKKSAAKGLGRGLDALLGDAPAVASQTEDAPLEAGPKRELPIEFLTPNPDQPRRTFAEDAIEELAHSIKTRGMLQPILVRPRGGDSYEIVAGERRWRAAQRAKLHQVPVIIRELTDEETAEIALIENVQRVDLNPVEEATAYQRLASAYGRTQEEIARAVGKSRSHIANIMRLLNLPQKAIDALSGGELTMGHARALLGSTNPEFACDYVIKNGLSVRETEKFVKKTDDFVSSAAPEKPSAGKAPKSSSAIKDADTRALERDLASILGLEVRIEHTKKGAGTVSIDYLTLDQLDDVCRRLMDSKV